MTIWQEILLTFSESTSKVIAYTVYSLKNPSFKNIYYCVFAAYLLCLFAELILPAERKHGVLMRKGFWLDTFYVIFNDILLYMLGFFGLCAVAELLFTKALASFGVSDIRIADITDLNPFLQILIMFLIQDFTEYWCHVLLHRSDLLWQFHKIHHAQEELGAASTRRFHWVEFLVFKPVLYLPFAMIGYSAADYFLFQITVQNVWGFFTHMNVKVKWGVLNYVINTPETHAWHHAQNVPAKYGVNYASILNIWDILFGNYYLPKNKAPILGVPDQKEVPQTFLAQMAYPFLMFRRRSARSKT